MTPLVPPALASHPGLLETAFEQSFNAVLITDADLGPGGCRIVYCNPAFSRMTGYSAAELVGQTPRILQGPLTDAATLQRLRATLHAGQRFEGAAINYRQDGSPYHVEWHISPLRAPGGQVTHFLSVQQDVTALKRAEQRRDLLVKALDVAPTAIFITDADGQIVYANPAFEQLTGYAVPEALGQSPSLLHMPGAHDPDFYRGLKQTLTSGAPFEATFTNRRRDGSVYYCSQSITAMCDPVTGQISHCVSVAADVSPMVEHQRRLQIQARRDALTGLYNRHAGEEVLHRCEAALQADRMSYAVVLADIDHFKRVNDRFGHAVGDRVLQTVARILAAQVRAGDAVVRWGGEEFLLILPAVALEAAAELAQRVRAAVAAHLDAEVGPLSISLGVAAATWGQGSATLVERADQALYSAKAQGRNRVVLADPAVSV